MYRENQQQEQDNEPDYEIEQVDYEPAYDDGQYQQYPTGLR